MSQEWLEIKGRIVTVKGIYPQESPFTQTVRRVRLSDFIEALKNEDISGSETPILPLNSFSTRLFRSASEMSAFLLEENGGETRELRLNGKTHYLVMPYVLFCLVFQGNRFLREASSWYFRPRSLTEDDLRLYWPSIIDNDPDATLPIGKLTDDTGKPIELIPRIIEDFWQNSFHQTVFAQQLGSNRVKAIDKRVSGLEAWLDTASNDPFFYQQVRWLAGPRADELLDSRIRIENENPETITSADELAMLIEKIAKRGR